MSDPTYRAKLIARAQAGTLAPPVEAMLWHYAYGKPRDTMHVTVGERQEDLSELSTEELMHRVDSLREQANEVAALERSLPAEFRSLTIVR